MSHLYSRYKWIDGTLHSSCIPHFSFTKLHLADDSATVTLLVGRLIDTYVTSKIDCSFARPRHFYCGGQ
ncbi:hypothetical protein FXE83_11310 [Vibrio cholerae]|nr:hypothetical protein FXE83_11310 [Vibrio cholerae]